MMGDFAIRAEGLSKRYRLGKTVRYNALRDVLTDAMKAPFRALKTRSNGTTDGLIWALKDLSFEIKQGDAVGIIGRNGAGKSTLLKILSRITAPTRGYARVRGRLASLLEVGTGFHPELSGRENIFLNGAILGMRKREIARKFDAIVAFAEIDKFVDTPVKYYSSGMYVRLAFSVAAHLEPDILLVDEVLAVGDAAFQRKCLGKMGETSREGRTVLFVSHNLGAMSALTRTCVYIHGGQLMDFGETPNVVQRYLVENSSEQRSVGGVSRYRRDPYMETPLRINRVWVNEDSTEVPILEMGAKFSIFVEVEASKPIDGAGMDVALKDIHGQRIVVLFSWDNGFALSISSGRHIIQIDIEGLKLTPGRYFADVGVNQTTVTRAYDVILDYPLFEIINQGQVPQWLDRPWGAIHWQEVEWKLQ